MAEPLNELWQLSRTVADEHDVAVVAQLFDRSSVAHTVKTIVDYGVPREPLDKFSKEVFKYDPFTDADMLEGLPRDDCWELLNSHSPEIAARRKPCETYWSFIELFGLTIEGVAVTRLRPGVYLTAGFWVAATARTVRRRKSAGCFRRPRRCTI